MIAKPEIFGSFDSWLGAFKDAFRAAYSDSYSHPEGRALPGFHVCLAGGKTPAPLYSALAADPELPTYTELLPLHIWVGDERAVSPDSAQRNGRMIQEAFSPASGWPRPPILHPWPAGSAAWACAEYEKELAAALGPGSSAFDLEVLGLGADGHTAGIFSLAALEHSRICAPTEAPSEPRDRMSLFPPLLASARTILVPVRGPDKAPILDALSAGLDCPFSRIIGVRGRVLYLPESGGASV